MLLTRSRTGDLPITCSDGDHSHKFGKTQVLLTRSPNCWLFNAFSDALPTSVGRLVGEMS